ncbi:MAG: hypothetical protein CVV47_17170 [Spirochaetae bacterium HGW-Spirochaetae-3]|jgi:DNA-binding transcriptional LysR family regulator|nr:MAG: hypothetical protein CVV47_17170 [Spirochaetae bacterium HGW-Spirochaetae-3]
MRATAGTYVLPGIVARLRETRPERQVKAIVDNTETIERLLLSDRLDFIAHREACGGRRTETGQRV